ncbi:MAG TPA: response regulator transcription factor [Bryobacteraceae bacterium]|nr:response regulator transcription factor [Bryobacteraceae bacterium]
MSEAKILIVDDEPQIRRVLRSALAKQNYFVADASSGEEALEKVRDDRYDLIVLDRNMPGIGGLEACHQIRSASDVAIIMLTVRKEETEKIEALDAGADDYVTKPFSMPELLARIRANLRRVPLAPKEGPRIFSFGEIAVNLGSRQVLVLGKDVHFRPKEFDVLHYLISNPNVVVPHGTIIQAIWGPDYGKEVEYLHVIVNQIRKKIEPEPNRPRYILTEPRVGYRFIYQYPDTAH